MCVYKYVHTYIHNISRLGVVGRMDGKVVDNDTKFMGKINNVTCVRHEAIIFHLLEPSMIDTISSVRNAICL